MGYGRMHIVVVTTVIAIGVTVVGPTTSAGASGQCSASPTQVLTGPQAGSFSSPLAANERVDANTASWTGTTSYPVYFDSGDDSCWDGGSVNGTFSVGTTWNTFHGNTGIGFGGARFTLDHPRVFNYGDGISVKTGSDDFLIKNAYLSYIHDDCVQNDDLLAGTIDSSYLDGCYVGFSARRSAGETFDGHLRTWNITNSLVRLQAMPTVYSGSAAGHGGFFKWDDSAPTSPMLHLVNTVFRADQDTNHQSLNLPTGYPVTCSGNIVVWLGSGAFPGRASWLAACPDTTFTTDRSVWDFVSGAWKAAHAGVVTGPDVSIGDASILEGTSGSRTFRFPLTLSTPPGTGKTVSVYWSTTPGTAGTSDFTPTKGKAVFTANQVLKMVNVNVKQDGDPESDQAMALVVAGIDGGMNHRERGVGTIVDDDWPGTAGLVVSDSSLVEGDLGTRSLIVPIALSAPATADVLINWSTVGTGSATAGVDYTARSGTVKIAALKRVAYVTIPVLPDTATEGPETFQVVVNSASSGTIVDGTGVVTILNDD